MCDLAQYGRYDPTLGGNPETVGFLSPKRLLSTLPIAYPV